MKKKKIRLQIPKSYTIQLKKFWPCVSSSFTHKKKNQKRNVNAD